MELNKLERMGTNKDIHELAKEQAKNSIKATIKNQMRDWKEIKSFMEELSYELWKEFN